MEKTTLNAVLAQVENALRKAIDAKEQGIAYMYICGNKCLTVSVESIIIEEATVQNTLKGAE